MYRILIANGVNLDLLGARPSAFYGSQSLSELEKFLKNQVPALEIFLHVKLSLTFFQSNDEASFLEKLSENWHAAVINPGAWTHTSVALADRLEALALPFVEVHLSQLARREPWRKKSHSAKHAVGVLYGFSFDSYLLGLQGIIRHLQVQNGGVVPPIAGG